VTIQKVPFFAVVEKHLKWLGHCCILVDLVVPLLSSWWRETHGFPVTAQLRFKVIVLVDFVVNFVRLVV
jgi:uncharacterized membrane protein